MYSLRKFCRLAAHGNPSILLLLWLPEHITCTAMGQRLVALRDAFVNRNAGERFLGYLTAQKQKLKGERNNTTNRPELVARYGYDTKFAMHSLRLGLQGIEFMTDGHISMPVRAPDLSTLRDVRQGRVDFAQALHLIEEAEVRLRSAVEDCRREVDVSTIDRFLVQAHQEHWATQADCGRAG